MVVPARGLGGGGGWHGPLGVPTQNYYGSVSNFRLGLYSSFFGVMF